MIRPAEPADTSALVALAADTGVFQPHEAEAFREILDDLHAGRLGEGHRADLWTEGTEQPPAGWVYFAPTMMADRVWDLWWIGVAPSHQNQGVGRELVAFVEAQVRAADGRLLLIETSSLPKFDSTRRFYEKLGYAECARVPDFYTDGESKVIYSKRMANRVAQST